MDRLQQENDATPQYTHAWWSHPVGASLLQHQTADEPATSTTGFYGFDEDDSGADTDTESSTGEFEYNFDDVANLPEEQSEHKIILRVCIA